MSVAGGDSPSCSTPGDRRDGAVPHAEAPSSRCATARNLSTAPPRACSFPMPACGCRCAAASRVRACCRRAAPVPDVLKDPRVKRDLVATLRLRSCILVPVRRSGEAVGVLKLQSSGAAPSHDGLKLAQVLAGTVSAGLAEVGEGRGATRGRGRLRRAQEAGGVGVFSVGLDGILHATPEFCRLYGLPPRDSYPSTAYEQLVVPRTCPTSCPPRPSRRSGRAPPRTWSTAITPARHRRGALDRPQGELERDQAGSPYASRALRATSPSSGPPGSRWPRASGSRRCCWKLGDRLRDLTDVPEVTRGRGEVAGTALGASRGGFGRLDATAST